MKRTNSYITTVPNTSEGLKILKDLKVKFKKSNQYVKARGRMRHRHAIFDMYNRKYYIGVANKNDISLKSSVAPACNAWALYTVPISPKAPRKNRRHT
jgi:hypothetical protein